LTFLLFSVLDLLLELLEGHGFLTAIRIGDLLLAVPPAHHGDATLHNGLDKAEGLGDDDNGDNVIEDYQIAQNRDYLEG